MSCGVVPYKHIVLTFYCPMIREIRGQNIFQKFVQASGLGIIKNVLTRRLYSITQSETVRVAVSKLMPTFTMGRPHCEKRAG